MNKDWFIFQEKICNHLKNLGFTASTNKTILGIRTNHDIDIYSEIFIAGQKTIWIIEAKYWNSNVSKLHVLALRTIIEDIGADKGFIISKKGFQKGAIESTNNTNIGLLTFDEFIRKTIEYSYSYQLHFMKERIRHLYIKYFAHSKKVRIKYELRSNLCEGDFYPASLLFTLYAGIIHSENNDLPIHIHNFGLIKGKDIIRNVAQLINWLNENLNFIDSLLLKSEIIMLENNDYNPCYKAEYVTHDYLTEASLMLSKLYITPESIHLLLSNKK